MSRLSELKTRYPRIPKGVRQHQSLINYFLALDKIRGASYGELAKTYNLDKSNICRRIKSVLNGTSTTLSQARD